MRVQCRRLGVAALWLLLVAPGLKAMEGEPIALPPLTVTTSKPGPALTTTVTVCPAWTIIVRDEKGKPAPGVKVAQIWKYYAFDEKAQDAARQNDARLTDAQGRVSFPERTLTFHAAELAAARLANMFNLNIHTREVFAGNATMDCWVPAGYKNNLRVNWSDSAVHDPRTVRDRAGYTTTLTLQRLDIYDAIKDRDLARTRQFLTDDPGAVKMRAGISGNTPLQELMMAQPSFNHANPSASTLELASLLLAAGADVNIRNQEGVTPLDYAVTSRFGNVELTELLLAHGADPKATDPDPQHPAQPIHDVASSGNGVDFEGRVKVIDLLLKHGVDVNAKRRSDGNTPLHLAADIGNTKMVQALLERGADPTLRNARGQTPLELIQHYATGMLAIRELLTHPPPARQPPEKP